MKLFRSAALLFISFLVLWTFPAAGGEVTIRILHVNDFHGYALPQKPVGEGQMVGGAVYLAREIDHLRCQKPSLVVAAGDLIQGHSWANLFQGKSVIELLNAMKLDVMVVGNHEFDFGTAVLERRVTEAHFLVLGANVQGVKGLKPYVIKRVGGVRLAIIGVVTPDTPITTHPKNVAGLTFMKPAVTVDQYLKALRHKADIFLVLSHLGYPADRDLAAAVKGIDVIIGGHTHTRLEAPVQVNDTYIVQAWEHGKVLGVLDLTVRNRRLRKVQGHLVKIFPTGTPPTGPVADMVDKYARRLDEKLSEQVGEALVDLDGEQVRERETNLGDLVADIMRARTGAEVALLNGGSIRGGIPRGPITVGDLYRVLPFDNYLVALKLTGRQLKDALEHGLAGREKQAGAFPQVSGLTLTYNPQAPPGARIREIFIHGQPLEPERDYTVAINDFMAAGGDGYRVFADALNSAPYHPGGLIIGNRITYNDASTWLRDMVIAQVKEQQRLNPAVEGRIQEVK